MSGVTIIDYGAGNLFSVARGFEKVGASVDVATDPAGVRTGGALVLPGVGAFGSCASELERRGLQEAITRAVREGRPLLGICVGMQLLFDRSSEFGWHEGLGLLEGTVEPIGVCVGKDGRRPKLPHIGWAPLTPGPAGWGDGPLSRTAPATKVYFLHSFMAVPRLREVVSAETEYAGATVCAAVTWQHVSGVQFHPEKSGPAGLSILADYVEQSAS